jgi:phosphoribosylformylglycinamidine synthase
MSFVCKDVFLRVENTDTPFTNICSQGQVLRVPVAHGEGRYTVSADVIKGLEDSAQVLYRYVTPDGHVTDEANPNGSLNNIAGVTNAARNVMGLMPHPERACEILLGSDDGLTVFLSLARHCNVGVA